MAVNAFGVGTGGFSFGGQKTAQPSSSAASGFSFGGLPFAASTVSTTTPSMGLGFGIGTASTTSSLSLGTSSGFSFGGAVTGTGLGLGGTLATTNTTISSIFNTNSSTAPLVTGLGGVDPKKKTFGSGFGGDARCPKDAAVPAELLATVDGLQKCVKKEKACHEHIACLSARPMQHVHEDIAAVKQLLSVVSNGMQRTTGTVEKLKAETARELKNAEMCQRMKDMPPGLDLDDSASYQYFERIIEQFEAQMLTYSQQIDILESHLSVMLQPSRHSPAEIFTLIKRLHETFITFAAQLQFVHEAIKVQKDRFTLHRHLFNGHTKDLSSPAKTSTAVGWQHRVTDIAGPTPFPGVTSDAAAALASVIDPAKHAQGPPVAGLLSTGTASYWLAGGSGTNQGLLPGNTFSQAVRPLSSFGGGLPTTGSLSTNGSLVSTLGTLNNAANTSFGFCDSTTTSKQPFSLQKPPQGAKRGKR